ncbi:putative ribonuclease H-like domain-containing protein, partial [Tanacetum coccineum]
PIPTTRIHKDHHIDQVIRDLQSATQTRRMSKNLDGHGKNPKGNSCIEGSKLDRGYVGRASTIQVTKILDFSGFTKGSKWIFRNKKDEMGIVIRNKARLVAQGYTQEEGIDYDKVFSHVVRIEAIRLFLAYASFKDFVVYQMDVKSAFLYEKIEEEVYVCQPPGFEDSDFPDRVYKVEKTLYGLHQAPRAWYETLLTYLLDNGFQRGKIDKTLFIKRHKGDILLVQVYVDDIIFGSTKKELCIAFEKLMHEKFQRSSMGKLTFFLGLQVKQKKDGIFISQDKYITEILKKFRSMIGSLMYLISSRPNIMFAVYACARYQVNQKVSHLHAVKRIFRYLKGQPKLGLWYLKDSPFDLVAYTDSDYAGASLDRKSTTRGCQCFRCRLISWQCKKQTVVANSTTEAEYVVASSCYGQLYLILLGKAKKSVRLMMKKLFEIELVLMLFWSTAMVKTIIWEAQLHALVDGKKIIITESSVRRDLQLAYEEDVDCLPNSTIFEQLTLMGKPKRKDTQVPQPSDPIENVIDEVVHKELGDSLVRAVTTASSLGAEQDSGDTIAQTRFESVSKHSNDSLLARDNTLQSDKDRLKLDELMALCTTLQNRVLDLEKTKTTQHNEIASLKRRVKKLEKKNRITLVDEESLGEDASKQERIDAIDADEEITLVSVHDVNVFAGEEVFVATIDDITLAQALEEMKSTKPKKKGVAIQELVEEANAALIETWDDIQAKIDVDYQLAERLQAQEQEELSIKEKATLFQQLLEKRRKHFATKRAEEKRNKPPTKAQQRKIMCTYLKNMEGYKLKDLKYKEFDSIQKMFDRAFQRVNIFEDFRTKLVEGKDKRAGTELIQENIKKQKVDDDKETAELK